MTKLYYVISSNVYGIGFLLKYRFPVLHDLIGMINI